MENQEFNLRNFLYNNPLLESEDQEEKYVGKDEKYEYEKGKEAGEKDVKEGLFDFLKKKKKEAPSKPKGPKIIGVDYDGNYIDENGNIVAEGSVNEGLFDFLKKKKKEAPSKPKGKKIIGVDYDGNYIDEDGNIVAEGSVKESALRKAIQNEIISILKEAEEDVEVEDEENVDVDVEKDVNVDVEKEVDIDDESEESEIEVDSELAGEDADTAAILGLLTKAQEEAEGLGDEKLMDQIGNTITYYTRAHVVKSTETRAVAEDIEINEFLGFGPDIKKGGTLWVKGTEGQTRFKKIDKGVYKVIGSTQSNFYDGEIYKPLEKKLYVGMKIGTFGTIEALGDGSGKSFEKLKI